MIAANDTALIRVLNTLVYFAGEFTYRMATTTDKGTFTPTLEDQKIFNKTFNNFGRGLALAKKAVVSGIPYDDDENKKGAITLIYGLNSMLSDK